MSECVWGAGGGVGGGVCVRMLVRAYMHAEESLRTSEICAIKTLFFFLLLFL